MGSGVSTKIRSSGKSVILESLSKKQIKKFVVDIVGEEGLLVLDACKKGCTDEQIMKKTKLKLSNIRSLLNRLHYMGVINYSREKDENTHWYTYTWFLKEDRVMELLKERWGERIEELGKKLEYETSYVFFVCDKGCEKLPFELAAEYEFKCPECGGELKSVDNRGTITLIKGELDEIKALLEKL